MGGFTVAFYLGGPCKSLQANRGVVFMGPNDVEVKGIPFPELALDSTSSLLSNVCNV